MEAVPANGAGSRVRRVHRGETLLWSLPVTSGRVRVKLSPGFVPAQLELGDDQRELSLMVQRCAVLHADGRREDLWGAKRP
jgi:hypothetical protein